MNDDEMNPGVNLRIRGLMAGAEAQNSPVSTSTALHVVMLAMSPNRNHVSSVHGEKFRRSYMYGLCCH